MRASLAYFLSQTATPIKASTRTPRTEVTMIAAVEKGNAVHTPEIQLHPAVLTVQIAPTLAVPTTQVLPEPDPEQIPD